MTARTSWPGWIGKALLESLLIVFSVVLALSVDNWREARKADEHLREARAAIVAELNRQLLASDRYLPHHRRLHEIYNAMEQNGHTDDVGALFRNGVHVPPLRDEAWRIFVASDVSSGLPFADRAMLATIYGQQANLTGLFQHMLTNVTQPTADRERPAYVRDLIRVIDLTLTDVVITETELDKSYAGAIARLSAK